VSIIAPTYKEAPNLAALAERVFAAVDAAGLTAELLIVDDDSNDGTEQVVADLAERFPVRLIVRRGQRGLSSAVVRGFREARYDRFVVIDADLQHPPETIPKLVEALENGGPDFVLGTRYGPGGAIVDEWPWVRRLVSWTAGVLARPLTPLTDPMAGFFGVDRSVFERGTRLNPIGYKIALEIYVKCRCRSPAEVPIVFATRAAGQSKLTLKLQLEYLRQLVGLYHFKYPWLIPAGVLVIAAAGFAAWR